MAQMALTYPLELSFKILAIAPQIFVRDQAGNEQMYVHMKAFKLKEAISVYTNQSKSQQLFTINADRIIDFSAQYHIKDMNGTEIGSMKREGMRSMWKASYNLMAPGGQANFHISEDDPWVKVADYVLSQIPLVGMAASYMFHPSYTTYRTGSETPVFRMKKQSAFFEGRFTAELLDPSISEAEQAHVLMANMMMILLERQRG